MDSRIIDLRLCTDGNRLVGTGRGRSTILPTRLAMPMNGKNTLWVRLPWLTNMLPERFGVAHNTNDKSQLELRSSTMNTSMSL